MICSSRRRVKLINLLFSGGVVFEGRVASLKIDDKMHIFFPCAARTPRRN